MGDQDIARKEQEKRAKKYGIRPVKGGNLTKPADFAGVDDDDFADPVNYKYPLTPAGRRVNARAYFNHAGQRVAGGYEQADWRTIGGRIAERSGDDFEFDRGQVVRKMEAKTIMAQGTDTGGGLDNKPYGDGAMVALRYPDGVSKKLYESTKGFGKPIKQGDHHTTIAYLGDASDMDAETRDKVRQAVKTYAAKMAPIEGASLSGTDSFKMGEHGTPFYAKMAAPGILKMREGLVQALGENGIKMASDKPFVPHTTLSYLPKGTTTPDVDVNHDGLSFGSMYLKFNGDDDEEYPLTGEMKAVDIGGRVSAVRSAWRTKMREKYGDGWRSKVGIIDRVMDDALITKKGAQTYRCPYSETEGRIQFGEPAPVNVQYIPTMGEMGDYKACTPEHAEKMFLKMSGGDSDNRVLNVADGNIIYENDGKCYRRSYQGEGDGVTFGDPVAQKMAYEDMPEKEESKAGRRLAAPKLSMLQQVLEKLSEATAQLNQAIQWGSYMDGTGKAFPDFLNVEALIAFAEEAKAMSVPDLPPMYLREVKATPNGVVVGAYMFPYGAPNKRDLQLDYATKDTNFYEEFYPNAPAIFHHGKDPVIGKAVLGQRDNAYKDDIGLWVQDWVNKSGKFWGMVKALLDRKMLYYSPGAVPHLVERTPQRQLKSYPIADDTFTPTPVLAPLLGAERSLDYIKSAYSEAGIDFTTPEGLRGEPDNGSTSGGMTRKQLLEVEMLNLHREATRIIT